MELRWHSDTDSWTLAEFQVSKSNPVSKWCFSSTAIHWNLEAPKVPYLNEGFSGQGQRCGLPSWIPSQSAHPMAKGEHRVLFHSFAARQGLFKPWVLWKTLKSFCIGIFSFRKPRASLKLCHALSHCTKATAPH